MSMNVLFFLSNYLSVRYILIKFVNYVFYEVLNHENMEYNQSTFTKLYRFFLFRDFNKKGI